LSTFRGVRNRPETAVEPPRQQQFDTLVAEKVLFFQQPEHAMAEELLRHSMVEIGHGHPLPGVISNRPLNEDYGHGG